jgi:hypothetical protein
LAIAVRLRRYDCADACGKWNSILFDDFRSDLEFIRKAEELFAKIVAQLTEGKCVASDGLTLQSVTIDFGISIALHFLLIFLDAPNGYGMAPAKLSVVTDSARGDRTRGTLCCGLSGRDGNFWYPTARRILNSVMPDRYDWAYSYTRVVGPPTISSWIDRRTQKRGEH